MHLNFDRLLALSIGFLLLFTAFNTAASLAAKVLLDNEFGNLGFYSLGLLYLVFGFFSFLAAPIVRKLGAKTSLVVGSLCYSFYVGAFILPALRSQHLDSTNGLLNYSFIYSVILFAACINGFGASLLWVAQGQFLA